MAKFKRMRRFLKRKRNSLGRRLNMYMGKVVRATARTSHPVYIVRNGGDWGYSLQDFFGRYYQEILAPLRASQTFEEMSDSYSYFTLDGITIRFTRSNNIDASTVACIPEIYFDVTGRISLIASEGGLNYRTATQSENSLRAQVVNQSGFFSKSYKFPDFLCTDLSTPVAGRKNWMSVRAFLEDNTPKMYLIAGHYPFGVPPFSSNTFVFVGDVELSFHCKFGKRIPFISN